MTDAGRERAVEPEIATTTLAEIYVQQGLFDRALTIYRRVAERTPEDAAIATRVAELEREIERQRTADPAAADGAPRPLTLHRGDPPAEPPPSAQPVGAPAAAEPEPVHAAAEPEQADAAARSARSAPPPAEDAAFLAWLDGK